MVVGKCGYCGAEILWTDHSKRKPRGRFCGRGCAAKKALTGRAGADTPNWKGGRLIDSRGYVIVLVPGRGYVQEHVLVAEAAIARRLNDGEVVHHVNGIITDNRNRNLLICDRAYHVQLHARDRAQKTKRRVN